MYNYFGNTRRDSSCLVLLLLQNSRELPTRLGIYIIINSLRLGTY